jgi:hypothetical protein
MSSTGLGVPEWPVDILLYMLRFCSLEDSLSFSMVKYMSCIDILHKVKTSSPGLQGHIIYSGSSKNILDHRTQQRAPDQTHRLSIP